MNIFSLFFYLLDVESLVTYQNNKKADFLNDDLLLTCMVHMSLRIVTFSPAYTNTISYRFHRNRKLFFAFHLASTRQRLKTITFENSFQREQYDNDTKTMYRCNTIVALSLKTISFSMKTYSSRRGLLRPFSRVIVFSRFRVDAR